MERDRRGGEVVPGIDRLAAHPEKSRRMRSLRNIAEIAVVGGGLAGLAAARHAARLGRHVTLFEGSGLYGGQVATVEHLDGVPAPGRFSGQDLAMALLEEARKAGVNVVEASVSALSVGDRLRLTDEAGRTYAPERVILATGAALRKLGAPGEEAFYGRGVSRCATCDGGFFKGEDVVVVGGGDSALQEALVLARTSRKVTMVCRSPLKAKRDYIDKLSAKENVAFVWDREVHEIYGDTGVTGVRTVDRRDGSSIDIPCQGVFAYVGVAPNSGFLPAALLDPGGRVRTGAALATCDPRVAAIGALRAGYGGNLVEAMAEGVAAAEAAARLPLH